MKIQWSKSGFRELRSEPGVVDDLETRANRVAAAASNDGGTYSVGSQQGASRPQGRWRTSVVTADHRAIRKNAKHNSLLKALEYGR